MDIGLNIYSELNLILAFKYRQPLIPISQLKYVATIKLDSNILLRCHGTFFSDLKG